MSSATEKETDATENTLLYVFGAPSVEAFVIVRDSFARALADLRNARTGQRSVKCARAH